jgi:hypothetical protein
MLTFRNSIQSTPIISPNALDVTGWSAGLLSSTSALSPTTISETSYSTPSTLGKEKTGLALFWMNYT